MDEVGQDYLNAHVVFSKRHALQLQFYLVFSGWIETNEGHG